MEIAGISALVTGGASGLGRATAARLVAAGAKVVITDIASDAGKAAADELGEGASFVQADVVDEASVRAALAEAQRRAPLRAIIHCAGRGGPLRILDKDGRAADPGTFEAVVKTNLLGSFNVLRLGAEVMAANEPVGEERGAIVFTASIAAFEGQIGQIPYAASKGGVVSMTLVAARDLAVRKIRVCTIAPGLFDTPLLGRVPEEARKGLAASIPHPARLGDASEFALLAEHILINPMLNGETIRLDGGLRMQPR